ncbi:hypothetical protein THIOSC13_1380002 [uncultured Thiomicrorhabdus sp.]
MQILIKTALYITQETQTYQQYLGLQVLEHLAEH